MPIPKEEPANVKRKIQRIVKMFFNIEGKYNIKKFINVSLYIVKYNGKYFVFHFFFDDFNSN